MHRNEAYSLIMSRPEKTQRSVAFAAEAALPEPLPSSPWGLFKAWFDEACSKKVQPNPHAMYLGTCDSAGRPAVRTVLCKGMDLAENAGYLVFYTNYESDKGRTLSANPRAALLFHWDTLDRQVRIEGPTVRSPGAESDAYFKSRPLDSRIGAWASSQSRPISSRDLLFEQVADVITRFGVDPIGAADQEIPRPPFWGGFRVWAERVELWVGGAGRIHDRARWERSLAPAADGFRPGPWKGTRLQP